MAYYEDLIAEQQWDYRPGFADAWYCGEFGEAEGFDPLAAALRSSYSGDSSHGDAFSAEIPAVSGGSEGDPALPKRRKGGVPPTGRVSKRKPRGSKRSATTTFIVADPENFRRMVQQVTGGGVNLGVLDEPLDLAQALEPKRIGGIANLGGGLPTLDTSAFLPEGSDSARVSHPSSVEEGGGSGAAERLFDSFCSFPTLESSWSSWKAV